MFNQQRRQIRGTAEYNRDMMRFITRYKNANLALLDSQNPDFLTADDIMVITPHGQVVCDNFSLVSAKYFVGSGRATVLSSEAIKMNVCK